MQGALLTTTSTRGLQPLGSAAQRSFELVTGAVRTRLGDAHARLFAEPVAALHGDQIDWHAPVAGQPVPLGDLPAPEQERVRARLGRLCTEIAAAARDLCDSANSDDQRLGEALANAIEIPAPDMIWVVEGPDGPQPVLVHWAWIGDRQSAVRGMLTGMVPRDRPADMALQSAPAATLWHSPLWWWLVAAGWLLLAAMLGLILWLMVHPCALAPLGPDFCRRDGDALAAAYTEGQVVQDRVLRLEHQIALADRACRPSVPLAPPASVPVPAFPQPERKGALPDPGTRRLASTAQPRYSPITSVVSAD